MIDEDYIACVQSQIEMLKVDRDDWKTKFELLKRENDKYKEYGLDVTHLIEQNADSRGYTNQFKCTNCGGLIDTAYCMKRRQLNYRYCPYCGDVVQEDI